MLNCSYQMQALRQKSSLRSIFTRDAGAKFESPILSLIQNAFEQVNVLTNFCPESSQVEFLPWHFLAQKCPTLRYVVYSHLFQIVESDLQIVTSLSGYIPQDYLRLSNQLQPATAKLVSINPVYSKCNPHQLFRPKLNL